MAKLTNAELEKALASHSAWRMEDGRIVRDWKFPDFLHAMEFVNRVAAKAETAGHHPDIDIRYNKVRLGLVTHDAGGVTAADVRMVEELDASFGLG